MYFDEYQAIEERDFWIDVFDANTSKAKDNRSKGGKYKKNKSRDILADFLGSNDIVKRFDFDTVRAARSFAQCMRSTKRFKDDGAFDVITVKQTGTCVMLKKMPRFCH